MLNIKKSKMKAEIIRYDKKFQSDCNITKLRIRNGKSYGSRDYPVKLL